ncbi:EamA family transporter [Acuticoccus mangrovi]|uniref:EamA family transporter n=1 Tax=Acuticoccus mangrovi TaxID=2796142 RepID=A0A934MMR5_9HYPH|nr:EamA family transporter [Acuticoccus mangrovi]MBJ3777509.1 EamA family transporter [Acuticoccus mangrovi]
MSLLGFALVLCAAVCHATWNLLVKRINGGPELVFLFSVVSVVLYAPAAVAVVLVERPSIGALELAFIAGSAIIHLGYFLLLQTGYRQGDLSLVYPTARATGPLISTLLAVLVLGEKITLQIAVGGAVIIFGVMRLTGGFGRGARRPSASLLFGLGAGLLIGSYTAWDAYTVASLMVPPLLLDYASSVGRVALLAPTAHRRRRELLAIWRRHRMAVVGIGVFNPLAYILVLTALTFTPVVAVAPVREVSVLLTVLAGSLLLNEGDLRRRLFWAAIILAGVTILSTA